MRATTASAIIEAAPAPPLADELRRHLLLAGLIAFYAAAVFVLALMTGESDRFRPFSYAYMLNLAALIFACVAIGARTVELALVDKEPRPTQRLWRDIRLHVLAPRPLMMRATPFIVLPVLIGSYSSFKTMIPALHPFSLDLSLYRLDQWLHFGVDPWRLTHALFGGAWATQAINLGYNAWFGVMWVAILFHAVKIDRPHARMRFLVSFVLLWMILGSLAAVALSSAGPCYFGRVTGLADPYAPLMARLDAIDTALGGKGGGLGLLALLTQDMLWQAHVDGAAQVGAGISAMPSLHVAVATLIALTAWQHSRAWGWAMSAYAALILVGSVHLGWHYAVDGYAAIAATLAIWWLTGRLLAWLGPDSRARTLGSGP
ncbi:MAG: PAP2 family protein [Alphaproteobacteria bacterium]|nr:MAG: PAP2 family protein [Alphaproteobacteria bacterium]